VPIPVNYDQINDQVLIPTANSNDQVSQDSFQETMIYDDDQTNLNLPATDIPQVTLTTKRGRPRKSEQTQVTPPPATRRTLVRSQDLELKLTR